MKNFIKNNWVLLLILVLAIFFRYWQINSMPGGLFPDEAANGLDINSMLHGHLAPFYERGNGREALFFYFEAAAVLLFGRGVWQAHIVSAGFGVAAVIALYFLTKRLFGKRTALIASFLMAVSSYAVTVTRTAFRANTVPLISILTIFFLVKFFQSEDRKTKNWSAGLAGLFFALGFYTYTSFRMILPLIFGFGFLLFYSQRDKLKEVFRIYTKYKLIFLTWFVLGIAWIASYYFQHPKSFVGRAGEVSIFNKELNNGSVIGTFIDVFKKTILAFFTNGDAQWRHNISTFPFLDPFISPFFALALIVFTIAIFIFLKQVWDKKIKTNTAYLALCGFWFWFMLVPEVTTAEGIPHGLRLTGVIPPLFILTAWGINWVWQKLTARDKVVWPKVYFATIFFAVILIYNFFLYFVYAASSPEYAYAFRSDLTQVSAYLNQRNLKEHTYLSLDDFSVQTTDYLTTDYNQPYMLVDPAHSFEVQMKKGDQIVFTQSTLYDRLKFLTTHKDAKLVYTGFDQFHDITMLVYEQEK